MGKGLSGALDGYNGAIGSLNRNVFSAARKLQDMGVQDGGKKLADLSEIEDNPPPPDGLRIRAKDRGKGGVAPFKTLQTLLFYPSRDR